MIWIKKKNPKLCYIEVSDAKKKKPLFVLGEKGKSDVRRFRYGLDTNMILYLELRNFRFSELIYDKKEEKKLVCPLCSKKKGVRRVFSTFKAIFDKRDRAPRPGDELAWHLDYKKMKDEEIKNDWVGHDHLNQYFNR